jgi:Type II secretion system protein C
MIVPALLGIALLAEATPVSSHIGSKSGPSVPWNPTTQEPGTGPEPARLRSDVDMGTERLYMRGQALPADRPPQNGAAPGRFLVLTGVIAYTDPKQGFAIIGNSVQNTFLARSGQQLPDGSWIREIYPKHVVLEHRGNLETLGIYRHDESAGTSYAEFSPLPQQARWEVEGIVAGEMRPSQARPTGGLPSPAQPSETRRSETPASEVLSNEAPSSDALPKDAVAKDAPTKQAQPEAPLPAAQDPADEFSDARRQRAENRGK